MIEREQLARLQAEVIRIARTWYEHIDLSVVGIDLGACLEYSIIQAVIKQLRNNLNG